MVLHRLQTNFFEVNKINFGEWHYQIDFLTESRYLYYGSTNLYEISFIS